MIVHTKPYRNTKVNLRRDKRVHSSKVKRPPLKRTTHTKERCLLTRNSGKFHAFAYAHITKKHGEKVVRLR